MEFNNITLNWLGHSGFKIKNSKIIYIDPYNIPETSEKADIILITHSHYDHCSIADMYKIIKPGTTILITADCQSKILRFEEPLNIKIIEPNQEINLGEIKISTIPAYNIHKPFHAKSEGWIGYLIKFQDLLIYHAGDTDSIPEMQKLTGYKQPTRKFIALLPVGGRFTMTAEEAADAAKIIQPDLAIPMHYGSIVGTETDAKEFQELCNEKKINVKILEKD